MRLAGNKHEVDMGWDNVGEEAIVTGARLSDTAGPDDGGGWALAYFVSLPGCFGADGFDPGGGGGIDPVVVTAPGLPAGKEAPPEEEVVVTAARPPTDDAFRPGVELRRWANVNVASDVRVTLDGDTARVEIDDVPTEQQVVHVQSHDGRLLTREEFDLDSYQRDPFPFPAPVYDPVPVDWRRAPRPTVRRRRRLAQRRPEPRRRAPPAERGGRCAEPRDRGPQDRRADAPWGATSAFASFASSVAVEQIAGALLGVTIAGQHSAGTGREGRPPRPSPHPTMPRCRDRDSPSGVDDRGRVGNAG